MCVTRPEQSAMATGRGDNKRKWLMDQRALDDNVTWVIRSHKRSEEPNYADGFAAGSKMVLKRVKRVENSVEAGAQTKPQHETRRTGKKCCNVRVELKNASVVQKHNKQLSVVVDRRQQKERAARSRQEEQAKVVMVLCEEDKEKLRWCTQHSAKQVGTFSRLTVSVEGRKRCMLDAEGDCMI